MGAASAAVYMLHSQETCAACLKKRGGTIGCRLGRCLYASFTGNLRRMSEKTRRHHWVPPRPLFNRLRQADRAACLKNKAAPLGAASPLFNRLRQADRAACLKNKAAPLGAASFKKAIKRSSAADYSSQPSINLMIAPISRTCSPSASLISSIPETFGRGS